MELDSKIQVLMATLTRLQSLSDSDTCSQLLHLSRPPFLICQTAAIGQD